MINFKKMPPTYSRKKDVLRFIQCVVIGVLGAILAARFVRYTQLTGILMFVWIAASAGASVFFGARAFFSWVLRL
jgi:CDP-diglyceride synthetase